MVWHLVSGLKNAPVIARWTFFSKFWNLPSETSLWALGPKYGQNWGFLVVLTPQMAISHLVMTIGVGISQKKNIKNFDHVQILWNDPYTIWHLHFIIWPQVKRIEPFPKMLMTVRLYFMMRWWQWLNMWRTLLTPGSLSGDWCLVLGSGHRLLSTYLKVVVLLYPETVHHHLTTWHGKSISIFCTLPKSCQAQGPLSRPLLVNSWTSLQNVKRGPWDRVCNGLATNTRWWLGGRVNVRWTSGNI